MRLSLIHVRILAALIALGSLVLVGLGGYVRGTGAGLACPDWPLCYGRAVPAEFSGGIAQEVGHRYLASIISVATLVFSVLAWVNRKAYPRLWKWMKVGLGVLFLQVILGGLTVLMRLNPLIVTAHLALGTLFFQLMAMIALDRVPGREEDPQVIKLVKRKFTASVSWLQRLMLAFVVLVYFQILLGGLVGSSGASLACPDLPLCFGKILPENATLAQGAHMLHRAIALLIFALALVNAIWAKSLSRGQLKRSGHVYGIAFLVLIQLVIGVSNVYFRVPVSNAVTHLVVAQLILLGALRCYRRLQVGRSLFLHADRSSRDLEFGEYTPTKRRFVANIH